MEIDGYKFDVPEDVKKLREKIKEIEEQNKKLFSGFTFEPPEKWQQLKERSSVITKELNQLSESICDALTDTWVETIHYVSGFGSELAEILKNYTSKLSFEIPDEFRVINIIEKEQYVFWDYLTQSFIGDVINSDDLESTLLKYEAANDYALSEEIIKECEAHPYIQPNLRLFSQAVETYHEGKYDLATVGFTAVIDGVLAEATGMAIERIKSRCKAVLEKLAATEHFADNEYAIVTLYATFAAMVKSFYPDPCVKFSEPEPDNLDRHWIMHGRSQREKTRLDCIKLLRFLYGIILVNRIDEKTTENGSAEEMHNNSEGDRTDE